MIHRFRASLFPVALLSALLLVAAGNGVPTRYEALLAAADDLPRPIEGRLSASPRHAVWSETPTAQPASFPAALDRDPVDRVRGGEPLEPDWRDGDLHRRGLLAIYRGKAEGAVKNLEEAASISPSAPLLSDLSATYLALAEGDQPWLRIDAIAAAQRAVEIEPNDPQAAFNLALALERLYLVHESCLAWERYLKLPDDDDWREEGKAHLAQLRRPTMRERWDREKPALLDAARRGDAAALGRLVREFHGPVKDLLEKELMPAAAQAVGTPLEGETLVATGRIAQALAESGEPIYIEAVNALQTRSPGSEAQIRRAYSQLGEALAHTSDCSLAEPLFRSAQQGLTAITSPFAWVARYEELRCIYRAAAQAAESHLVQLASDLEERPYPTLRAKTQAMLGLCAVRSGRYSESLPHYEEAIQILAPTGAGESFSHEGMLDEAYRFLGDRRRSWSYRLRALSGASKAGDRRYFHMTLTGLARELARDGRRAVALPVIDEMLFNARSWREAGAYAQALLRRIQLEVLDGDPKNAPADIAECARLLERFPQPNDRERTATELMIASAEAGLQSNPNEAYRASREAVARAAASNEGILLPRALLAQARAEVELKRTGEAESTFERALSLYEAQREETGSEELRISFFASAQPAFDALIALQSEALGEKRTAFFTAERVRARGLRDRLQTEAVAGEPMRLEEALVSIPKGTAVVAFAVLEDRVLVWRLFRGSLTETRLPVPRRDLAALVSRTAAALRSAASESEVRRVAGSAYEALLRGPLAGVPPETELVFIPDRELYQVPFAALFDARRGRFLVEDHASSITPCLTSYLASLNEEDFSARRLTRVLAIGDPDFDPQRFSTLRRLPGARAEAEAIAGLYPEPTLLTGAAAKRSRILAALPGQDVVDLAAHVVVDPRDPLKSVVVAAGKGESPLQAFEIDRERWGAVRLVFLASCDTAPGFPDGNREGLAGLARAFLGAGVPYSVGTLWQARDYPMARLSERFHRSLLGGKSPSQSLRYAQIALLRGDGRFRSLFWAPVQLFRAAEL